MGIMAMEIGGGNDRVPITPGTAIQFVPGVGGDRAPLFQRLGLHSARDALFFFPRDYDYPGQLVSIDQLRVGVKASVLGRITEVEISGGRSGKSVLGALVENSSGAVRLLYFNQPYRAEKLPRGSRVIVSGRPRLAGFRFEFVHPHVTLLGDDEPVPAGRILPIYPLVEGLKQSHPRKAIGRVVEALADGVQEVLDEPLRIEAAVQLQQNALSVDEVQDTSQSQLTAPHVPVTLEEKQHPEALTPAHRTAALLETGQVQPLPDIATALRDIHCPSSDEALQQARRRLIFQELLVLQLALALRRRRLTTDLTAPPLVPTALIDARIRNRFPFALTADQSRAIQQVGHDMSRQFPMNRLIQGDVGSGKTVVAQYAMLLAVAHGYQAVMMAPTEVLARQHHQTLTTALAHSRVRVGLLVGSLSVAQRREVLRLAADGQLDVLVGTQALLYGEIRFAKLGLCVIDEQHKFGVTQREALRRGGLDPHYLVLSATPIPRTVMMTLFGDLDVSTLKEKPPGRGVVHTYLAEGGWRQRWWRFVTARLDEGRQAFVVTPRVQHEMAEQREDDQPPEAAEDVSSAVATYDQLCDGPLAGYRVDLLHGRMSSEEKTEAMRKFAQGRTQVLVTTTVIEVGIDVPNATVMTVLGAERFGLAQLHQLRGRVSRGAFDGHVCLFTDADGAPTENQRLKTLAETQDGFAIAEADFRLRGPGDLLGRRQSGMPAMRIADLGRDGAILRAARDMAQEMIELDPQLDDPARAGLKRQVLRRYGNVLELGDVA